MAAMVAPSGDRSIAMIRDCFVRWFFSGVGAAWAADFADCLFSDDAADRLLEKFDIEILFGVKRQAPHHRSPTSALRPAGQGLRVQLGALGLAALAL